MTGLDTAPLGTTDMTITRIGAGAFALGGARWSHAWSDQSDTESVAALRHAIEEGINWIDTATIYGHGHSEEVVAEALSGIPKNDRPFVFTKGGIVWDEKNWAGEENKVADAASLRKQVEGSLRRLKTEQIDLYQVRWPPTDGTVIEDYWRTLLDLKSEGKVRALGLSNHDVLELEKAEQLGHVDALQPPFSLIHRESALELLPWCYSNNTGVIVYSPMQAGLLTGTFSAERAAHLPANDWRSRENDFTGIGLQRNLALAEGLASIASKLGVHPGALAIAWTLHVPGVTEAIVGARRPSQLDDWIGASRIDLDSDTLTEIAALVTTTGAGQGPVQPATTPAL